MKSLLAFLAIFSLLLLYNTVDGRKHPEEFWGRNMRIGVPMGKTTEEKSIEGILDHKAATDGDSDPGEEEDLGTSSEPVGSGGGGGGGDPKEEPLGTSSEPVGSGGGDPKRSLFFKYYGHKVPGN